LDSKTPRDIARQLLALAEKLPPGEWRAFRHPKDGVANAGDTGTVKRYEHPQDGLGLLGVFYPAWSTCEFVVFARTHAEPLARAVIDLQEALDETAKRASVWEDWLEAVVHELERSEARTDGLAKANEALRARLEAAERAVEAARPFCKIGSFFSVALAAYDAARTVERDPFQP
jgi:hypothetical protein